MVAIYARQSVDKKDSISIETQIEHCKMKLIEKEDYEVYSDKGYSGSNIKRPDFEKMIFNIQEGLVTKVICYKVDRISRSTLDFSYIINLFKKKNVEFVSCQENFDTTTPMGKAMLSIIMTFAELERESIQGRVKDNYYARGKEGRFLGGPPPFGFTKEKTLLNGKATSALLPIESEIDIVKKIFKLYDSEELTLGEISKKLATLGVKTAKNVNWDSSKISRIMRNPAYVKADMTVYKYYSNKGCVIDNTAEDFTGEKGCFLFGKRTANERKYTNVKKHHLSLGLHDGIIDSEIFLRCQDRLSLNTNLGNTGKGKHTYLSGILKCGYCGYAMTAFKSKGEECLRCSGKYNYHICTGHENYYRIKDVEDAVEDKLFEFIKNNKDKIYTPIEVKKKEKNEFEVKISKLENAQSKLIDMIKEGVLIDTKSIASEINKISLEMEELQREYDKKERKRKGNNEIKQMGFFLEEWDKITDEQKKRVVKCFIDRIKFYEYIEIEWNQNLENI